MDDTKKVYSVVEVAKILDIGINQTYEAIRRNEIPHLRFGRRIIIPCKAFDAKLENAGGEAATS